MLLKNNLDLSNIIMINFIIAGTSGVGKTFLQTQLVQTGYFYSIPVYTNRSPRPNENHKKNVCIPTKKFNFLKNNNHFFYHLDYNHFHYGWKKSHLNKHPDKSTVFVTTLESLKFFLPANPNFIPILLKINQSNLDMIKNRMYQRQNYFSLSTNRKLIINRQINQRLALAKQEIKKNNYYCHLVKQYHGLIFDIQDDKVIFKKVIPSVLKLHLQR